MKIAANIADGLGAVLIIAGASALPYLLYICWRYGVSDPRVAREIGDSMLVALKALKLECLADVLNPCWANRSTDKPGLHWGSEPGHPVPACSSCVARAA